MPVDVLGTIGTIIDLAFKLRDQLQLCSDVSDEAKLLRDQVDRVSSLLSSLQEGDATTRRLKETIPVKNWQSDSTLKTLAAINDLLEETERDVTTLSEKGFLAKFFTAGKTLNAFKSATARLSQLLAELQLALGIEHHAQLLAELRRVLPTIQDAVRDAVARPSQASANADSSTDEHTTVVFGPGSCSPLAAQPHEELQVAQQHPLRPAKADAEGKLLEAVKGGNLSEAQKQLRLCASGTILNMRDEDGLTVLHLAAKSGFTRLVQELLERRCDLHAETKNGYTPLHLAALYNNEDAVRLLVGRDAAVEAENKKGETPLHVACLRNHKDVVQALIGMGANVHARTKSGATPLRLCCDVGGAVTTPCGEIVVGAGAEAVARLLLRKGASVDERDAAGCAPLHAACSIRDRAPGPASAALVRALVQEGRVSVELVDTAGRTPLLIAAESGNSDAAAALLSLGASVDARTWGGLLTPLHVAAQYNQLEVAAKLRAPGNRLVDGKLVKVKKAEVDARDQAGSTPLHVAAHHGSKEVADLLLSHRADIEAMNREGLQPVHVAARADQVGVLKLLLDKGAKVDSKSKDGKTPMELAPVDSQAAALLQERRPKSSMFLVFRK